VTFRDLYSFRRYRGRKSEVADDFHANVDLSGKKDPLRANFQKCFPKGIRRLADPRLVCKFREIWPTVSWWNRALLTTHTQKNKISACSVALASARIAPKICHSQLQTMCSEYPKFHPNRLPSGGVIAERVNTVQTRHKVFPILGEASSPSND